MLLNAGISAHPHSNLPFGVTGHNCAYGVLSINPQRSIISSKSKGIRFLMRQGKYQVKA
jgi:hypothetical protein